MNYSMEHVLFITKNKDHYTKWCDTNSVKTFLNFIQYVLDSCNKPEEYFIYVVDKNICVGLVEYANKNGMHKRTPEERNQDIITGSLYKKIA